MAANRPAKKYHSLSIRHDGAEVMVVPVADARPGNKQSMLSMLKKVIEHYEVSDLPDPKVVGYNIDEDKTH